MDLVTVHHFLQSFLLPPLNALLIILIGGILLIRTRKKFGINILIIGIILLYIQSTPLFAFYLRHSIESKAVTKKALENAQAIVILGGGLNGRNLEYPNGIIENTGTLIRLQYGAYLAHKYPDKPIVVCGGYTGAYREADVMRDTLIQSFYVKNKIIIENKSRNTNENAKFAAQILLPMGIKDIVVVSQAYHTARATMLFKKYGLNAVAAPTDFYYNEDIRSWNLKLLPNAQSMNAVSTALHEIFGYIVYVFYPSFL